jgi:hypothetical protein
MHSADSAKVLENPQPRSNETPDATGLKRKGAINSMAFDFDPTDLPQWLRWQLFRRSPSARASLAHLSPVAYGLKMCSHAGERMPILGQRIGARTGM